jgi:glycerol-3-phosphate dehydrogenase
MYEFFFDLQKIGERVTEDQLHDILNEVDLNKNAQVDLGEFLQVSY